jgi:peroxiredoxin (alkyl hydroperoxide reductase subunit C)
MIKQGDMLPSMKLMAVTSEGPREISTEEIFKGKRVVMFAVPGAFTPTCSARHLPGFNEHLADFRAKGIDTVVCMAVNDAFVMGAWAKSQDVSPDLVMLADGSGLFTQALGLELDLTQRGLGVRSQRFALVADDMRVTYLAVEQPGDFEVSRAEAVLAVL